MEAETKASIIIIVVLWGAVAVVSWFFYWLIGWDLMRSILVLVAILNIFNGMVGITKDFLKKEGFWGYYGKHSS